MKIFSGEAPVEAEKLDKISSHGHPGREEIGVAALLEESPTEASGSEMIRDRHDVLGLGVPVELTRVVKRRRALVHADSRIQLEEISVDVTALESQ